MALVVQIGKVPDENGENRQRNLDMEKHPAMRSKANREAGQVFPPPFFPVSFTGNPD